jgi:hypothetical protein
MVDGTTPNQRASSLLVISLALLIRRISRTSASDSLIAIQFSGQDRAPISFFLTHVSHVSPLIAYTQVVGPNACSVIAKVHDKPPIRNRGKLELICGAMSGDTLPGDVEAAISGFVETSLPGPTTVSFSHLSPISLLEGRWEQARSLDGLRSLEWTSPDLGGNGRTLTVGASLDDMRHDLDGGVESRRNFLERPALAPEQSNGPGVFLSEFAPRQAAACATLASTVLGVCHNIAQEKVIGADTGANIAGVANELNTWIDAIDQLEGNSVGIVPATAQADYSVAIVGLMAGP